MASSLNSCSFIGRVGRDPEIKKLPSGVSVVSFSIGVNHKTKDTEETEWVNCAAFEKLAEVISQYATKGTLVYINGRMKTDKYTKDGRDVYTTKILVKEMQLLSPKQDSSASPGATGAATPNTPSKAAIVDDGDVPF